MYAALLMKLPIQLSEVIYTFLLIILSVQLSEVILCCMSYGAGYDTFEGGPNLT